MEDKLSMLNESKILSIFQTFLRFALGETILSTTTADPWLPWPFP